MKLAFGVAAARLISRTAGDRPNCLVGARLRCRVALVCAIACSVSACVPKPRPIPPIEPSRIFRMSPVAQCEGINDTPEVAGALEADEIIEQSGIVASPTHPGVLWVHNDGDDARLFAMTTTGASLGSLAINIEADDLEDLAGAPCPDLLAACLYLCDCGDNDLDRDELVIYAVLEPDVAPDRPLPPNSAAQQVWRFPLGVPEGPANVEAFVVNPDATAIILYEKERDAARVLRLPAPWTPDVRNELQVAARITAPGPELGGLGVITGAGMHPSGERLLIRTYVGAYEARVDPTSGLGAAAVDAEDFVELFRSPPGEPQGEAIAYDEAGTGVWTVSETAERLINQPLHHAACR